MTTIEEKFIEEYLELGELFGKCSIDMLFAGVSGYIEVRKTETFAQVKKSITKLYYNT